VGIVKQKWLGQEGQGWSNHGTSVYQLCTSEDAYFRSSVRKSLDEIARSYYGSKTSMAATVASLTDAVLRGIKYSYNDEVNTGCPYRRLFSVESPLVVGLA